MKKRKIISLLLAFVLTICCMTSCGEPELPSAKELTDNATAETSSAPYSVNMYVNFTGDDEEHKDMLSAASISGMRLNVDGDRIDLSAKKTVEGIGVDMKYTVVGGIMYVKLAISAFGTHQTVKQKAELNSTQLKQLLSENNASTDISIYDFEKYSVEKQEDVYVITCTGITERTEKILRDSVSALEGYSVVDTSNVKYVIKIKDGKYDSLYLSCDYKMSGKGKTMEFTMRMGMKYEYDTSFSIYAPDDSQNYTEVDFDNIRR